MFVTAFLLASLAHSFQLPRPLTPFRLAPPRLSKTNDLSEEELLSELRAYLADRSANPLPAPPAPPRNAILDFTSMSPPPVKPLSGDDPLTYSELVARGYGHLVTPLMNAGGRYAFFSRLGLSPPKPKEVRVARSVEIDRDSPVGEYSGLKLMQVTDDEVMAAALESTREEGGEGEAYIPFAGKRQAGSDANANARRLDEEGERRGRREAEARRSLERERLERGESDAEERFAVEGSLRAWSSLSLLAVALGFGRATPVALEALGLEDRGALAVLASLAVLLSVGSTVLAVVKAGEKNRSAGVWAFKAFLAGPAALVLLDSLDPLEPPQPTAD